MQRNEILDIDTGKKIEHSKIEEAAAALLQYCASKDWAGFDPYDALNSAAFCRTPFFKSRFCRLALTQLLKRLPVNIRPLLRVSREQNPKAIGLFLSAFVKLSRQGLIGQEYLATMEDALVALRSPNMPAWSWGYSFPWQTRTKLVPRGAPNLVCTVFAANALLDAYELGRGPRCLSMAASAARYLLHELYWQEGSRAGFSYPLPGMRGVHNANFLGASLLSRIYRHTGEKELLEPALRAARYSADRQHGDGSWDYGESPKQRWVDNFHTGYNLCALRSISQNFETAEFDSQIRRGFDFYRHHFFTEDGAPRYFRDRTYPIDIHSAAQSIITFIQLKDLEADSVTLAGSVYRWVMRHMRNDHGYFYYQILPLYKNKISYMRWSQAWMLLALATLVEAYSRKQQFPERIEVMK